MDDNNEQEQFDALGLDHRVVRALLKSGFIRPTNVQMKSIPIALEKKDILMRAKTGSGKTLAYSLPLIENILRAKRARNESTSSSTSHGPRAIILAPTQELIHQIGTVIASLTAFCNDTIKHLPLSQHGKFALMNEKPRLEERPDIIICTPSRLVSHLEKAHVSLTNVEHIIIDEADLIITHDFEDDIKDIVLHLPSNANRAQIVMCSATLNPNTTKLQEFFLMHHPSIIDIDGMNGNGFDENKLTEYYFETKDYADKFIVMYALLKLNIISGKSIVFVNNIDTSYRLKLFLEKFLIPSAVLNPKLPYNSRQSVIDKFNRGLFKYLITTDALSQHDDKSNVKNYFKLDSKNAENEKQTGVEAVDEDEDEDAKMQMDDDEEENDTNTNTNNEDEYDFLDDDEDEQVDEEEEAEDGQDKNAKTELEANKGLMVYRGVDFREVAAVINFSAAFTLKRYIHRVGRTARAGNYGVAITLVTPREMKRFRNVLYQRVNSENSSLIQKLPLNIHDLDAFRYRCDSVRCSITPRLIKTARLNELRMEILNSKRLQSHFKERKREYELLRHDKMLQPAEMVKPHMSVIPAYMLKNTDLAKKPDDDEQADGYKSKSKRKQKHNAIADYKETFGQLPPLMREQMKKQRLRKAMKHNPKLKQLVWAKRRWNLKYPKKEFNHELFKNYGFLDKSTLLGKRERSAMTRKDPKVYVGPVKGWRDPLKLKLVKTGKMKPSLKGLGKKQIKKIKKRAKMKKLAKRR